MHIGALVTFIQQHLLAQADAQRGLGTTGLAHGLGQTLAGGQAAHGIGHGALPRKDHPGRAMDDGRIGRDLDAGLRADMGQRSRHRMQVAHPEIDDGDARRGLRVHQPTKLPLVEGTWPAVRGSGSAAMRSARPKALKTVSHW